MEMEIETVMKYVKPELVVVAFALYIVGIILKSSKRVKDENIPITLGILGITLSILYLFAAVTISNYQDILMVIFTGITQGLLVAGLPVYFKQVLIQNEKNKE